MDNNLTYVIDQLAKIPQVKAIYLFGSHAKGTNNPMSDIDLCVITPKNIMPSTKARILARASDTIDISILIELPPIIAYRVFRDGKQLYVRKGSELLVHRAQIHALTTYLDMKHFIDTSAERVLEAP